MGRAQLMALDRRRMAAIAIAVGVFATNFGAGAAPSRMLSDKKPNKGVVEAHSMAVQGIDVSYWQGDIDWQKVSKAGVLFAYIKATEGPTASTRNSSATGTRRSRAASPAVPI